MEGTFIATAAFGLEGLAARELGRMGLNAKAENGGARFICEMDRALDVNLRLRCADRVLLVLGERTVTTFEELFQAVRSVAWEQLLSRDAALPVSGKCVRSQLMSVRDCQAVAKKAIVSRLQDKWRVDRLPETGAPYPIDIAIVKDQLRVTLDFSGEALSRRGYRTWNGEAPIRETLAAAIVELSPFRPGMPVYDPCCGTGTLLIEAAMRATHRAPGVKRSFACERFRFMDAEAMRADRDKAAEEEDTAMPLSISGSDIDPEAVDLSHRHIVQAGYADRIFTHVQDLKDVQLCEEGGVFLCNPPYGERLSDRDGCHALYREMGLLLRRHPTWSLAAISADPAFERFFGRRAAQKRRLYNGRLECDLFMYPVAKSPAR